MIGWHIISKCTAGDIHSSFWRMTYCGTAMNVKEYYDKIKIKMIDTYAVGKE